MITAPLAPFQDRCLFVSNCGNDVLDLGLSDADQDGLVRYKRKWASLEGHVRTLVAGPAKTPEATALGPVLGGITSLLTDPDVPAHVARSLTFLLGSSSDSIR